MPGSNPLVNGSSAGYTPALGTPADAYPGGSGSMTRTTGIQNPLAGDHNTPAHVALIVLVSLGVLALFQIGGFRFVVDAGIGS